MHTYLEGLFLHVDGIYLVNLGFVLLSCGIGKRISAFCWYFSSCFMLYLFKTLGRV
jgi:hypothetical protein